MKTLYLTFRAIVICLALNKTTQLQAQAYIGTQFGHTAYTMMFQNNYGQRLLKFNVETENSFGIITGVIHKRRHLFQIGLRRMQGSQTFYDDVFKKRLMLQYMSIPVSYGLIFNPKKSARTKFYASSGLALNILTAAALNHYIHEKKTTLFDYATINPFDTYQWENPNIESINRLLSNEDDLYPDHKSMFKTHHIAIIGSIGAKRIMGKNWHLSVELFGLTSITDIHSKNWRLPRGNGASRSSHNFFGGLFISALYHLK